MVDWKAKLTSRKFWAAVVSFVALLVIALGGTEAQATQVTALIMAGATVMAYIVGEGMIDAASAGATVNITGSPTITTGDIATTPPSAPVAGTVDTAAPESTSTGAAQAAEVKADTALSSAASEGPAVADGKTDATAASTVQTASQPESGAVASGTTGSV